MISARRSYQRPGFMLIELLFSGVLFTLVASILYTVALGSLNGFGTIRAQAVLQLELGQALDQITGDIRASRMAINLNQTCADGSRVRSDSVDTLLLLLPPVDASGQIVDPLLSLGATDAIYYRRNSTTRRLERRLCRAHASSSRTAATEDRTVGRGISAFDYGAPPGLPSWPTWATGIIDVALTGSHTEQGMTYATTLTRRAVYRNDWQ